MVERFTNIRNFTANPGKLVSRCSAGNSGLELTRIMQGDEIFAATVA